MIQMIREKVDFTYEGWDPAPKVLRYKEGHDWKNPQILVDYLPTGRMKNRSIGNVIGTATPLGAYHEFGYCQPELVTIRCYAGKHHKDRALNGRLLADHFAEKVANFVLKTWDFYLWKYGASVEEDESLTIIDASIYDGRKSSYVYIYEFSFYILTQMRWDDIPYGEDDPTEILMNCVGSVCYDDEHPKTSYGIEIENKALE